MKSTWILLCLIATTLWVTPAHACDVCGCMPLSLGNLWAGMQNRHMFTLEGRHVGFRAHDGQTGADDFLYQLNLSGRLALGKRLRLNLSAPLSYLTRTTTSEELTRFGGLGDASLMAEYNFLNSKPDSMGDIHHRFWLGAGIKAPTGNFQSNKVSFSLPPNFQLGTGSWDGLFSLNYMGNKNKWSWAASAMARLGTENKLAYRLPNLFQGQVLVQYQIPKAQSTWMPEAGLYTEKVGNTAFLGYTIGEGGSGTYTSLGCNYLKASWAVGAQVQVPVIHNYSEGAVRPTPRLSFRLAYVL